MNILKENLHRLLEQIKDQDNETVYTLLHKFLEKEIVVFEGMIVEADNSHLSNNELKAIESTNKQIENDELVDWEDLERELDLQDKV
mgnify:CR=1 FL=1